MEIDPSLQLRLFLGAALWGITMGVFRELLVAIKILLLAYAPPAFMVPRYARRLPLIHRSVPFLPKSKGRRLWRGMVVALLDCLFCVIFALGPILLLYAYNDGELRLSVPVLALLGLGTWHALGDRLLRVPMAYFAYGSAAAMLYAGALLRLPLRGLCLLATRLLLRPVVTLFRHMTARRMQRRSCALCQRQLQWASIGFTGKCPRIKKNRKERKGMRNGKKTARGKDHAGTMGDPHPHSDHIRPGSGHRNGATDGVESAAPARRGAAAGKGRSDLRRARNGKLTKGV